MKILKRHRAAIPRPTSRVDGWEHALLAVIAEYDAKPFAWGTADCLTLVADSCMAVTGMDPLLPVRGEYSSAEEASQLMAARGCADVLGALGQVFEQCPPAMARRGDVGVLKHPTLGYAAVVVAGPYVVGRHERGSFKVPLLKMVAAFKVGR